MRRFALIGLLVFTSLVAAPAARASDDSLRQVVKEQTTRQVKADAKFKKAVKSINSLAKAKKARTATIVQQKSVDKFHDAVHGQQADSDALKTARTDLLSGLSLYNHGLDKLRTALSQAIKTNGRGGSASAKSALKDLSKAQAQITAAVTKFAS